MANEKAHESPNFVRYYVVFSVIAVLMVATFALSFTELSGPIRLGLSMAIATTQAVLLTTIFMHLGKSDKVTVLTAITSLVFVGILFVFLLTDYLTRHMAAL